MLHGVTGADGHRTEQCIGAAGQPAAGAVIQCYRVLHGVAGADGHRTEQCIGAAGHPAAGAGGAAEEGRRAATTAAVLLLHLHCPQGGAGEAASADNRSYQASWIGGLTD